MTLVVGLGNPGEKYRDTRHNVGFKVVDFVAERARAGWRRGLGGLVTEVTIEGVTVPLLKPQTFMNDSGRSVVEAARFYQTEPPQILVVHDELDLPFGQIWLKLGGGDAGHNGLKSVSAELGTAGYARLRLGIGRPTPDFSGTVADYVLRGFASEELVLLPDLLGRGAEAVKLVIRLGLAQAMNQVNQRARATTTTTTQS